MTPRPSRIPWGLLFIGLAIGEVALVYLLTAVETRWTPAVHQMLAQPSGAFAFVMGITTVTVVVLGVTVAIINRIDPPTDSGAVTPAEPLPPPPADYSLSNMTLGLALPAAIVAFVVPARFESLLWLFLLVPVGLVTLVMAMITVATALSPAEDVRRMMGNSRFPRLAALLIAGGAATNVGWLLGGAVARDLGSGNAAIAGITMLVLARLTFPFRR